jgi:hypothetical protein
MAASSIATTRSQEFQLLGTGGQTAVEAWSSLVALLGRRLSPAHAQLLTEPVANPARGEIDWYAEGDGPALPLPGLPEPLQSVARGQWQRLRGEILELATRMRASRDESERLFADMLGAAVEVPDESYVRVRNDNLLLVAWGHRRAGALPEAQKTVELTGEAPMPLRPMVILPPPVLSGQVSARGARLATFLSALLLLAVLFVMLRDPFGWSAIPLGECTVAPGELTLREQLLAGDARGAELRAQLAQLADDAGRRRLQCAPLPPPRQQAQVTPPPQPPPSNDERRATERGAHSGKLQIILAWDDRNDLDLRVDCPNGHDFIGYDYDHTPDPTNHPKACGGERDTDANGDTRRLTSTPVETVYFANPAPGTYRIIVYPYEMRASRSAAFRVTIKREGEPDRVVSGTASAGQRFITVTTVEVPAS